MASFLPLLVGGFLAIPSTLLAAPRVAVIETKNTAIVIGAKDAADRARGRRDIAEAVSTAVERAGGQIVVPAQPLAEECSSHECVKQVGSASGATDVLVIDAAFDQDSFKLHLDMWSASSGEHLDGEGQDCDGCTVNDLTKALRDRTTLLCDRVFRAKQGAPAPKLTAPPPTASPAIATVPSLVAQPPPAPSPKSSSASWLGWSLVGVGVAAGAASVAWFALNHHGEDCSSIPGDPDPCARQRDTIVPAIGTAVVAAGALIGGGVLIWRSHETSANLTAWIQPGGLTVGGRL